MAKKNKPKVAITLGDINGIGPEIVIKTLSDQRILNHLTPIIFGSSKTVSYYRKQLKIDDFSVYHLNEGQEPNPKRVNIVECWQEAAEINLGKASKEAGEKALLSLKKSVEYLQNGLVEGIVTAPINKATIQTDEFNFPGHTEFFGNKFNGSPLMFMVAEKLRIAVATGHVPLKDVPLLITSEHLTTTLSAMKKSLKYDFGIEKPKIAVLGLNPHAGEGGLLGAEEKEVIIPLIKQLKEKGELVFGPFPADGFFGSSSYKKYDGILAMYHDQGLIPFKSLAFGEGVNFTANLSIVRTSPDHGTGYDIAGKGIASESSFRNALFYLVDIIKNRADSGLDLD